MGAWIETIACLEPPLGIAVAPFMGAWIETKPSQLLAISSASCSLYGSMD